MRKAAATAAILALAIPGCPAKSADLGGPPATFEQILAVRAQPALRGCYVESGIAGTFLKAGPRQAQGSIGGGCDITAGLLTVGAGIRADWGDWTAGSLFAKAGLFVNPNMALYGLGEWRVRDWKVKDAGQLQLGAGVETTVFFSGLSAYAETTASVAKFGPAASRDDVLVRLGARYRF